MLNVFNCDVTKVIISFKGVLEKHFVHSKPLALSSILQL